MFHVEHQGKLSPLRAAGLNWAVHCDDAIADGKAVAAFVSKDDAEKWMAEAIANTPEQATTPVNQLSDLDRTIQVGGYIRLAAKTDTADSRLRRYGCWWSIVSGSMADFWHIQSARLGRQPKTASASQVDVMNLPKITGNSPEFRLVQVLPSGTDFNYKKHHDGSLT